MLGANGFKVMDPFNWTKNKSIYQRWQLWSEKARLTLDAIEGDSEKTKFSYFHHWINGEGMRHIESWKNSNTLNSQSAYDELENKEGKYSSECIESYFILFELLLAPKSNPLLAVEELHFAKQGSMTSGEFHSHIVNPFATAINVYMTNPRYCRYFVHLMVLFQSHSCTYMVILTIFPSNIRYPKSM